MLDPIRSLLATIGVPEVLDDPDRLAEFGDHEFEVLERAYTMALELTAHYAAADADEEREALDVLFLTRMTLSTARYLRAVLVLGPPAEAPALTVLRKDWQGHPMHRSSREDLDDLLVPTQTLNVLEEIGLPADRVAEITFDERLERVAESEQLYGVDDDSESFFRSLWKIGVADNGDLICIDERADGTICRLEKDWGFMSMIYVSASISHYLHWLALYRTSPEAAAAWAKVNDEASLS